MVKFNGQARRDLGNNLDTQVKGVITLVGARLVAQVGTKRLVESFDCRDRFLIDDIDPNGDGDEFNSFDVPQ